MSGIYEGPDGQKYYGDGKEVDDSLPTPVPSEQGRLSDCTTCGYPVYRGKQHNHCADSAQCPTCKSSRATELSCPDSWRDAAPATSVEAPAAPTEQGASAWLDAQECVNRSLDKTFYHISRDNLAKLLEKFHAEQSAALCPTCKHPMRWHDVLTGANAHEHWCLQCISKSYQAQSSALRESVNRELSQLRSDWNAAVKQSAAQQEELDRMHALLAEQIPDVQPLMDYIKHGKCSGDAPNLPLIDRARARIAELRAEDAERTVSALQAERDQLKDENEVLRRAGGEIMTLTVILRDDGPMINCGDSPTYRSVQVELTADQISKIKPKVAWTAGVTEYFEQISKCFIEPESAPEGKAGE